MNNNPASCAAYGAVVAILVAILKKLPWLGDAVARNPKVIASLVSALGLFALVHPTTAAGAIDWTALGICTVQTFAAAVATHEVVLDPVARAAGLATALTSNK